MRQGLGRVFVTLKIVFLWVGAQILYFSPRSLQKVIITTCFTGSKNIEALAELWPEELFKMGGVCSVELLKFCTQVPMTFKTVLPIELFALNPALVRYQSVVRVLTNKGLEIDSKLQDQSGFVPTTRSDFETSLDFSLTILY